METTAITRFMAKRAVRSSDFIHTSTPAIVGALRERWNTGRPYKNPVLEEKRQAAIRYLRYESKIGWIHDGGPIGISAIESVHADR